MRNAAKTPLKRCTTQSFPNRCAHVSQLSQANHNARRGSRSRTLRLNSPTRLVLVYKLCGCSGVQHGQPIPSRRSTDLSTAIELVQALV